MKLTADEAVLGLIRRVLPFAIGLMSLWAGFGDVPVSLDDLAARKR